MNSIDGVMALSVETSRVREQAGARTVPFERSLTIAAHQEGDDVRAAAEQLVSSAFVLPILEELRSGSTAEGAFAPGVAERRFGPLFDQQIADRVVSASGFGLVDSIVARMNGVEPHGGRVVDHVA